MKMPIELNKVYNENCLDTMSRMPDNSIDLVVTSPPYDNLRDYKGYSFEFESIAKELFRVIKFGGVVVWVVGDAVINGSESGTSFKQALYFKELGFSIHDTMIYMKDSSPFPDKIRYSQCFEYMFILSKGKPEKINLLKDRKNKWAGQKINGTERNQDGTTKKMINRGVLNDFSARYNVWSYGTGYGKTTTDDCFSHPAMFPELLCKDHIVSWSNEGDTVYDPFMGSGTTAKSAIQLNRNYIGSEISAEYFEIINKRLDPYKRQIKIF